MAQAGDEEKLHDPAWGQKVFLGRTILSIEMFDYVKLGHVELDSDNVACISALHVFHFSKLYIHDRRRERRSPFIVLAGILLLSIHQSADASTFVLSVRSCTSEGMIIDGG